MATRSRNSQEPEQDRPVRRTASEGRPAVSLESAEKILAAQARWREKNKDKIRTYQRTWREKNKDKVAKAHQRYQKAHPDKVKEWHRKSRLRQQEVLKQARELIAAEEAKQGKKKAA